MAEETRRDSNEHTSIDIKIFANICSPGANTMAVWYRASIDEPVLAVQATKELRELLGIGQCGRRTGTIEFLAAIEAF